MDREEQLELAIHRLIVRLEATWVKLKFEEAPAEDMEAIRFANDLLVAQGQE